jgi:hypothetical protein
MTHFLNEILKHKKRDSAFSNKIPTWVGERSEISNLLREDLERVGRM